MPVIQSDIDVHGDAFAQNRQRALAGQMMGRNRHPAGGNMTLHGVSSINRIVRRGLQKLFHV